MRMLPCGPRAILAEFDSLDEVMVAAAQLRAAQVGGVVDIVPAARTILVQHVDADPDRIAAVLAAGGRRVGPTVDPVVPVVVPVRYDGEDLPSVAAAVGCSVADVIELHSSGTYVAAFCGFMPGFTYLTGLDPRLQLPRRSTPRSRVPSGAVAIASEYTGVYPSASPGGWHLIGSTDVVVWDESRPEPALIVPGASVRFVAA